MLITRLNPIRTVVLIAREPATHELLFNRPLTAIEYPRCPPPDEATVKKLNALAAASPFCRIHKAKQNDTL